jgi:twitching motility protein PilT
LGNGHAAFRFSEVVQSFLVQTQALGLENDRVVAIEFLPIKSQIRGFMMKEDFASIDHILSGLVENSGLVTLNQSLLQLLIRRRIDLKTAFEMSLDPEVLDQSLRRAGV